MAEPEEGVCKSCSKELVTVPWNSVTDITYCNNSKCSSFHRPVKNDKSYAERTSSAGKRSIKARLEKMRRILYHEELEE